MIEEDPQGLAIVTGYLSNDAVSQPYEWVLFSVKPSAELRIKS